MQVVESWGGCFNKKRCTVNCVFFLCPVIFSETHWTFQGKKHEVETPSFVQGGFVEFVLLLIIAKKKTSRCFRKNIRFNNLWRIL